MDENAEIDIEALSDEVYIPLNLLPAIVRNLNSRLAAIEHEHSADDITSGTLPAARIAEGSLPGSKIEEGTVTLDRFEKSVRDSLSRGVVPDFTGSTKECLLSARVDMPNNGVRLCFFDTTDIGYVSALVFRRSADWCSALCVGYFDPYLIKWTDGNVFSKEVISTIPAQ